MVVGGTVSTHRHDWKKEVYSLDFKSQWFTHRDEVIDGEAYRSGRDDLGKEKKILWRNTVKMDSDQQLKVTSRIVDNFTFFFVDLLKLKSARKTDKTEKQGERLQEGDRRGW